MALFPEHGNVACKACFPSDSPREFLGKYRWQLKNNPIALGSRNPVVLLLGFSKGPTQEDSLDKKPIEEVAFEGMDARIEAMLRAFNLLPRMTTFRDLISEDEG